MFLSSDSVPSGGAARFRFTRIGVKSQRFKRTKASVCASNPVARASKISWSAKWAMASVSKMNFKQCSCWREARKRMMCYIYLTICLWKFSMLGNGVRLLKSWVKMMRKRMRIHKSKLHGLVLIVWLRFIPYRTFVRWVAKSCVTVVIHSNEPLGGKKCVAFDFFWAARGEFGCEHGTSHITHRRREHEAKHIKKWWVSNISISRGQFSGAMLGFGGVDL